MHILDTKYILARSATSNAYVVCTMLDNMTHLCSEKESSVVCVVKGLG